MIAGGAAAPRRAGPAERNASAEEARLVARVALADARAFERLYRLYQPRLWRFLIRMTNRSHIAEEVLDDTLMVVWNRAATFDGTSKVSTWIFAIAYRSALAALRRHREPVEDPDAESRASPEPGPDHRLGLMQARGALLAAMDSLSADHRAVVELTYFQELGYREIATIMACPIDTVKTRMHHARRNLKRALGGEAETWL